LFWYHETPILSQSYFINVPSITCCIHHINMCCIASLILRVRVNSDSPNK
jgi:hypothetical protein